MKKLLLTSFLFLGAAASMSAQDFYVEFQGNPVENGSVVDFTKQYEVIKYDDKPTWATWKVDPELYLVASTDAALMISTDSNVPISLCAGGNCINGDKLEKPIENIIADEPLNLRLDWETDTYDGATEYQIPEINVVVKIWPEADPTEVYSFTLNMGGVLAAGVEELLGTGNEVVLSGNTLYYDLAGASELNVYSLSGRVVLNKTVSGNGNISLSNLPKGVYLYKLSGKVNKAAKIIIR